MFVETNGVWSVFMVMNVPEVVVVVVVSVTVVSGSSVVDDECDSRINPTRCFRKWSEVAGSLAKRILTFL